MYKSKLVFFSFVFSVKKDYTLKKQTFLVSNDITCVNVKKNLFFTLNT